jgi:GNAT superfamily N-acetyltransferase
MLPIPALGLCRLTLSCPALPLLRAETEMPFELFHEPVYMPSLAEITVIVTSEQFHRDISKNPQKLPLHWEIVKLNAPPSSIAAEIHAATIDRVNFLAITGDRVIGLRQCEIHSVAALRSRREFLPGKFFPSECVSQGKPYQDAKDSELVAYADWTTVLEEWRRLGVATKLANDCDYWLKRHGIHYVSGAFANEKGFQAFHQRKAGAGAEIATQDRAYFYRLV